MASPDPPHYPVGEFTGRNPPAEDGVSCLCPPPTLSSTVFLLGPSGFWVQSAISLSVPLWAALVPAQGSVCLLGPQSLLKPRALSLDLGALRICSLPHVRESNSQIIPGHMTLPKLILETLSKSRVKVTAIADLFRGLLGKGPLSLCAWPFRIPSPLARVILMVCVGGWVFQGRIDS